MEKNLWAECSDGFLDLNLLCISAIGEIFFRSKYTHILGHEIYDQKDRVYESCIGHLKCINYSCIVFSMFTEKSESDDTPVSSDAEKIDTMLEIIKNKLRASK